MVSDYQKVRRTREAGVMSLMTDYLAQARQQDLHRDAEAARRRAAARPPKRRVRRRERKYRDALVYCHRAAGRVPEDARGGAC